MKLVFYLSILVTAISAQNNFIKSRYPSYGGGGGGVKTSYTKTKTKTSSNTDGNAYRPVKSKYTGGCNHQPPPPANAGLVCSSYSGCRATCAPQFQFPNGATQVFYVCEDGNWMVQGGGWEQPPHCQPICLIPCLNNGICIAPDQCQCPQSFSGPYCQFESKACVDFQILPKNSRKACSRDTCAITCMEGHEFPDGSSLITVDCKDGFWVPTKENYVLNSVPDCLPVCRPSCLNGGICMSFNRCQCPKNFRGPQCQYPVENCAARKLQFNGGYNCSGDQTGLSCVLKCAEGMEFSSLPAPVYTCLYQNGFFLPAPIPQCVFGEIPTLPPIPSNLSGFDLNSLKINGLPPGGFSAGGYGPVGRRWDTYYPTEFQTENPHMIEIIQQKMPEPGVCFTWEGTHYKTFDGKVFSFSSRCAYTLVRDSIDNTFSVIIQNDPKCLGPPNSCTKIIKIYFDKKEYILKQSAEGIPVFETPKKRLAIPGQFPGLRIEMSAHFIIVLLDAVGATIKWDGQQLVQVEVQESLWNRTEGLCGVIDGDLSNDDLDKNHNKVSTISNLASSWKIENLETECNDIPAEEHACIDDGLEDSRSHKAALFCKTLLNDPRFAPCHYTIDVSLVLDACRWDYCNCPHPDPTTCACETMNVYVRACVYKGIKGLVAWRDDQICPMTCTGGKIYKACGPAAGQPVCGASTEQSEDAKKGCVEGCYCPEGTVLHNNQCITRDKCPCKLRSKDFPPGAEVSKECNTCNCNNGKWICTQISCGARCAAVGDPHYTTFDGKRYDFMGQCSYYLVKTNTLSIEAENVACSGAISAAMNLPVSISGGLPSCTKALTIKMEGQIIKLKQNHDLVVNGQDVTEVPYRISNITIRSVSSVFLIVDLPNGIQVWWDGTNRAYIDIPPLFTEKTKGLCGTFNNNQKDDFLTPENDVEKSVIPFANKWKTSEKCADVPDLLRSHPCSVNIHNQPVAEKHCEIIKSSTFAACHWLVDPESYYQDCLYDMCSCEFKVSKCLCSTVAAYAEECARQNVKILWRDSVRDCGIHCSTGQKYQVCGNTCTRTCLDIATRPTCTPQCVEGCNCPEGEALDDIGECIPIGECKCYLDGIQFHAGYKEIRNTTKGSELCTCLNANWNCGPATPQELAKYPKSNDVQTLCSATENKEFTHCETPEPVTCKNMHDPNYFSASICHPGCKCKDGFVVDTTTGKCVKPAECPCHHSGRSYKENATVQNDCNTCKCQNGKWKCTDRPCSADCYAWGDSHFNTFDGKQYDFQGQCDYVLSTGSVGANSFDVSIQNVPCGTLGTSCSKSVTIRIKSGETQDVLTLTKDKSLAKTDSMKLIRVRQKGLFVIVETPDLGIGVHWDKGTRVYVKLDPRWKSVVKGLCGNYNDNDADDFQTPSGGLTEASAKIFGDSWKLQAYCPEANEVTNTCDERPDRKVWALKKCGVLKSSIFAACHSEVPVDTYLEKCIFDSCACDQGGDCECLCTALSAYAQECNNHGVPVKWRSQKLCPMQCDERCSNYHPCISTCPIETCDSILTHNTLSKSCQEDACIEGCAPKLCPPDQIFLNSSYLECVPRNVCKPICLEVDGLTFYEGDLIEEDLCHNCFCSRGEKVCKGQPCGIPPSETEPPSDIFKCENGWTQWINQDQGLAAKIVRKKDEDVEPLPSQELLRSLGGAICEEKNMVDIECRTVKTHLKPEQTNYDVKCDLENGLTCKTSAKGKLCQDFEIRVYCDCRSIHKKPKSRTTTTTESPTLGLEGKSCDPLKPNVESPKNCYDFYQCQDVSNGAAFVKKTCGPSMYYNPVSMVCDWPYSVTEIKPECLNATETATETPIEKVIPVIVPTIKPDYRIGEETRPVNLTGEEIVSEICPPDSKRDKCAVPCDRLCIYYSHVVQSKGYCLNEAKCQAGCVKIDQNFTCPEGMFWVDGKRCVSLHDCMCRSTDGKPVKPGTIYKESDCKVCQCINNEYTCDESKCEGGFGGKRRNLTSSTTTPFPPEGATVIVEPELPLIAATVTPPEQCTEDRFVDLIQGIEPLPDEAFDASSVLSENFKPSNARFSSETDATSGGSWSPEYSNTYQYLQVDFGKPVPVYGVKIKGSPLYDEYVTSFKVGYTDASGFFTLVANKEGLPQVFSGCIDRNTLVQHLFEPPFEAQIIKIFPDSWHGSISLKLELIGCGEAPTTTTPAYEFISVPISTVRTPLLCDESMGLDEGYMSDQQISVSSELDNNHTKSSLRLSDDNAWQPLINSKTEFVQFDFLERRNVTGIETKGGPEGWVKAFIVMYSDDDKINTWNPVLEKNSKKDKIFSGNFDTDTPKVNYFDLPICAKYLKIIPTSWENNIQMRVEVYGCYEPYPTVEEPTATTVEPSTCNTCPDVKSESLELEACRCKMDKWWDGNNCVDRTECPCVVGHITYKIGTSYKKEDCSECLCKIGGTSYCTPKSCDPCEKGLRSTVSTTCQCICQPCPDDTILCPTSNVCINSTLWCDGIQNCPDDETNCTTPTTPRTPSTTPKPLKKKCRVVTCPLGYKKQLRTLSKARSYHSLVSSFSKTKSRKVRSLNTFGTKSGVKGGVKGGYGNRPYTKRPETPDNSTEKCSEYQCVPLKDPPKYIFSKVECPPPTCPEGFVPDVDKEYYNYKECPKYTCVLQPPPDSICNVTGRTFNTFDGTEYKYDICNHILAEDIENGTWEVTLKKNCSKICVRNLVVYHNRHTITLYPDLTLNFDGFYYSEEQSRKIGAQFKDFSLSHIGSSIVFISYPYDFWILWDKKGNVKLGTTSKNVDKISGLCGFFNEDPSDDKKKPDGTLSKSTADFVDSWKTGDLEKICEPQTCPVNLQIQAWEICQVKQQALGACSRVVNKDAFISRCIENTCECLQTAADNKTATDRCRCKSLEDYVVQCLSQDPTIDISNWRVELDCPVSCPPPLVFHDCYQRQCEMTCNSISNADACPKLPNVCFPGCYCPSGFVKKGDSCISSSDCRDCECNVLPHLQYITYDDTNFTVNGNCVYVMSRDALLDENNEHKFQVLITNAPCKNNQAKNCVGKVTILYENHKIHIYNDQLKNRLKLIVDGERIDNVEDLASWAKVRVTSTKHLKILLTDSHVEVSVYYPSLGVSVKTPSHKYGGKLEGLCGNCDRDPRDDLRTSSGNITNNTDEFALSWLYDKIPGQTKELCHNQPDDCEPLPKETDPCNQILNQEIFGQCLKVLDPSMFLEWCQKDTCDNHPELACAATEAFAVDCLNAGFCVNWRTNLCPAKQCPSDQIYNPCGSHCPETCESIKQPKGKCSNKPVEGCFCPEGKVLRNNTCVIPNDCEVCDDLGHRSGDEWQLDECTKCICLNNTIACLADKCSSGDDQICGEGFQVVTVPKKEGECCDKFGCAPEPTAGATCETPQPITCGKSQITKLSDKGNGCTKFICECRPLDECTPIDTTEDKPLADGYVKINDTDGCCPIVKTICNPELCPKPKPCEQYHTLRTDIVAGGCCPLYSCEPPPDKCIYDNKFMPAEFGGQRLRNEMEKQKVLKNANETWEDGPCRQCKCTLTDLKNYQAICTESECPALELSQDFDDYQLIPDLVYNQCCPNVKRVACKHNNNIYKPGENWTDGLDYCTVYECVNSTTVQKETRVTKCDSKCNLGYEYIEATLESKECCGSCRPYACVIDGVVQKVGAKWNSADYCTNFECANANGSITVQANNVNCPTLPEGYEDEYVIETIAIEGQCCKQHNTTACKVNGKVYKAGESWPSPDGDKCKKVTCSKTITYEVEKKDSVEMCNKNCSKGEEYQESNRTCCGKCVQIGCVVDDELKFNGENWTSPDTCTLFTCEHLGDQFMVSSSQESCPSLDDCPEENIYVKGCCQHCNITTSAQKNCASEELAANKTSGLIKIHRAGHGDCTNKQPIKGFTECLGICESSTTFNAKKGIHESLCTCCQATQYTPIEVDMECEDGYKWIKKITVPSDCSCKEGCGGRKKSGTKS